MHIHKEYIIHFVLFPHIFASLTNTPMGYILITQDHIHGPSNGGFYYG